MVRLAISKGRKTGASEMARRFPFVLGRDPRSDLCLDDAGVWPKHASLGLDPGHGFTLRAESEGALMVNGERVRETRLRNGDVIELGGVRMSFALAEAPQRSFQLREWGVWVAVALLCAAQIALVYWVLP